MSVVISVPVCGISVKFLCCIFSVMHYLLYVFTCPFYCYTDYEVFMIN